jgi:hypothetical protein
MVEFTFIGSRCNHWLHGGCVDPRARLDVLVKIKIPFKNVSQGAQPCQSFQWLSCSCPVMPASHLIFSSDKLYLIFISLKPGVFRPVHVDQSCPASFLRQDGSGSARVSSETRRWMSTRKTCRSTLPNFSFLFRTLKFSSQRHMKGQSLKQV